MQRLFTEFHFSKLYPILKSLQFSGKKKFHSFQEMES